MRRRAIRLGSFVLLQAVVVFILLECTLRVARPFSASLRILLHLPGVATAYDEISSLEELMEQTVLGFAPHTEWKGFVLNSRSFRTREYPVARAPGALRVVALGDSFTVGAGRYARTWPALLETELARALDRPVEVFALGVPGVGPEFELRVWELERDLLAPDLVVLGFFVGNDLTDDADITKAQEPVPFWLRHSLTIRLVRNLRRARHLESPAAPAPGSGAGMGGFEVPGDRHGRLTFSRAQHLAIEADRMRICLRRHHDEMLHLTARVGRVLERLAREVRRADAELVVMLIPDEFQVDDALQREVLAALGVPRAALDADCPQRRLGELLDEAGIRYLDLLPTFRDAGASHRLYYPRNTHWNDRGNALASRELARYLTRDLFAVPASRDRRDARRGGPSPDVSPDRAVRVSAAPQRRGPEQER
jgi:hypothetical protein